MNTILMNNWFSVSEELKKAMKWILFATISIFAIVFVTKNKYLFFTFMMFIALIPFNIPAIAKAKDRSCQWERFSLTLPITRRDIVNGNFKFFVQITAIFFCFAVLLFGISVILSNVFNFENPVTVLEVSFYLSIMLSISLAGQSLRYCISLISKDSTSEMFQLLIVSVSTLPCGLPFYWFGFIDYMENTWKYVGATLGLIALFVVISYVASIKLIDKKEF